MRRDLRAGRRDVLRVVVGELLAKSGEFGAAQAARRRAFDQLRDGRVVAGGGAQIRLFFQGGFGLRQHALKDARGAPGRFFRQRLLEDKDGAVEIFRFQRVGGLGERIAGRNILRRFFGLREHWRGLWGALPPLGDGQRVHQRDDVFHALAQVGVVDVAQARRHDRARLDQHREDVLAHALGQGEFLLAVFRRDRLRREQINKTLAPRQPLLNLVPPGLAGVQAFVVPDVVNIFEMAHDLLAQGFIDARVADEEFHRAVRLLKHKFKAALDAHG